MKPIIAVFVNHPECSHQCINGMMAALDKHYTFKLFDVTTNFVDIVDEASIIAFPGGIGDADTFYKFFTEDKIWMLGKFLDRGGRYLGICMGAYWAGKHYFNILHNVDAVQYIKRPNADVRRSFSTSAAITWNNIDYRMFFYDGCALIGDESKFKTIARYANGDPMAIIQNRIGIIGCHPESEESWYDKPYLEPHWHNKRHHRLLLKFVDELMSK
jgi:Biotin-protein ligase, N terminal